MARIGLIAGLFGIAMAWTALAASAHADCISDCQAATYCDSEMTASGECSSRLNACYATECSRTHYGAIAYDRNSGAVGWSYDFYDASSAEQRALANCQEHGPQCEVVVDFWNTCAAVAASANGRVEYGLGRSQSLAESAAIDACGSSGGKDCTVQAWTCTGL